jgi:hypothetical protein
MKRLLGQSIIIVVLQIFLNKIDGNHKDSHLSKVLGNVKKNPYIINSLTG